MTWLECLTLFVLLLVHIWCVFENILQPIPALNLRIEGCKCNFTSSTFRMRLTLQKTKTSILELKQKSRTRRISLFFFFFFVIKEIDMNRTCFNMVWNHYQKTKGQKVGYFSTWLLKFQMQLQWPRTKIKIKMQIEFTFI